MLSWYDEIGNIFDFIYIIKFWFNLTFLDIKGSGSAPFSFALNRLYLFVNILESKAQPSISKTLEKP